MPTLLINDLGGGVNEGTSPNSIQDREFESLINFIPFAGKLTRRYGCKLLSTIATMASTITGLIGLRSAAGVFRIILGSPTQLARFNVNTFIGLTNDDGVAIGAGITPWIFSQYKGIGYGTNLGQGAMRRISNSGQNFDVAGIPAPAAAPTIADGAAGLIEVGNVYVCYTYYNTATGAESNPSPPSLVLAHGANLIINWANITVSADPQVNARRLYRTTPGSAQNSPKLFIGQINDNVTLVFADNIPIASMGDPMKTIENGLPPTASYILALHNERLFLSDALSLYPSEIGLPESYDPTLAINVSPNDGHLIRSLFSFQDRLIIGKSNKVYALSGVTRDDFALSVLSEDFGCYSQSSMQSIAGSLFWFAGTTVCRSDGVNTVSIADIKLKNRLANVVYNLPAASAYFVHACIDPIRSLYIITFPVSYFGTLETWAYNYKLDSWTIFTGLALGATIAIWDANFIRTIYATSGGNLFEFLSKDMKDRDELVFTAVTVNAPPIAASFKTKRFSPGAPGTLCSVRRVALLLNNLYPATINDGAITGQITLQVYRDGEVNPVKTRVVNFVHPAGLERRWMTVNLSTLTSPGASFAIGVSYSDAASDGGGLGTIDIEAMAVEYVTRKQRVVVI